MKLIWKQYDTIIAGLVASSIKANPIQLKPLYTVLTWTSRRVILFNIFDKERVIEFIEWFLKNGCESGFLCRKNKILQKKNFFAQQVTLGTSNLKFPLLIQFFQKQKTKKQCNEVGIWMKNKDSKKEKVSTWLHGQN